MSELPERVQQIEVKARALYREVIDPLAARFELEPAPPPSETSGLPMVLLLGNHSSGKSSFINWLCGDGIQRTGIAPIDDGFTVITWGAQTETRDGEALITNPKLSWGDLRRFGHTLVSHLRLKLLPNPALEGIALVDSPGMIDAADSDVDRGYDFPGVVRWFAERADVILLMFDPDKPGTTGETLQILTESLTGLDHKLLLLFNKVDRFDSMRDYARAYGALCWNLAKAIPRKDLPHIFTTYLPGEERQTAHPAVPLDDFDRQRDEVKAEVQRAPYRRVDNVISRLYQHSRRALMHVTVLDLLARERQRLLLRTALAAALITAAGLGIGWLAGSYGPEGGAWKLVVGVVVLTLLSLGALFGLYAWDRKRADELPLEVLFERAYARELTLGDEADDLRALWASVRERLRRALATGRRFPRARRAELKRLKRVIGEEVPALRAQASEARAEAPVTTSS